MYEIPPVFSNFVNLGLDCSCLVKADTVIRKICRVLCLLEGFSPRISFLPIDPIPLYLISMYCCPQGRKHLPVYGLPKPYHPMICMKGGRLVLAACMHKHRNPLYYFPFSTIVPGPTRQVCLSYRKSRKAPILGGDRL